MLNGGKAQLTTAALFTGIAPLVFATDFAESTSILQMWSLALLSKTGTDTVEVHGIRLLDRHPVILFGDGGVAKSYLALFFAGELVRRGLRVLYADWELDAGDHSDRLQRLFGADAPQVMYARCVRPMTYEAERLARLVRQHKCDYIVCDSVVFACDGPPEAAESAQRYFQALRQIGVGSLNLAHTTKSDDADKKPFGSAFWHNGARNVEYQTLRRRRRSQCDHRRPVQSQVQSQSHPARCRAQDHIRSRAN